MSLRANWRALKRRCSTRCRFVPCSTQTARSAVRCTLCRIQPGSPGSKCNHRACMTGLQSRFPSTLASTQAARNSRAHLHCTFDHDACFENLSEQPRQHSGPHTWRGESHPICCYAEVAHACWQGLCSGVMPARSTARNIHTSPPLIGTLPVICAGLHGIVHVARWHHANRACKPKRHCQRTCRHPCGSVLARAGCSAAGCQRRSRSTSCTRSRCWGTGSGSPVRQQARGGSGSRAPSPVGWPPWLAVPPPAPSSATPAAQLHLTSLPALPAFDSQSGTRGHRAGVLRSSIALCCTAFDSSISTGTASAQVQTVCGAGARTRR